MISDLGLSISQLNFLIQRKYRGAVNGIHYVLAENVDEDENGYLHDRRNAFIEEWRLSKYPCPTEEDIRRIMDMFEDELKSNVEEDSAMNNEDNVIDTGV